MRRTATYKHCVVSAGMILLTTLLLNNCGREQTITAADEEQDNGVVATGWIEMAQPSNAQVNDILVIGGNTIFVSTAEGGLFKSEDEGASWDSCDENLPDHGIYVLFTDSVNFFCGTNDGVWKSNLDAATWERAGLDGLHIWALTKTGGNRLFAGTSTSLFWTDDDGTNWTIANDPLLTSPVTALAVRQDDIVLAGMQFDGVIRSTDNGQTWASTALVSGPVLHLYEVADGSIFAGTLGGGGFFSTNGGTDWMPPPSGFPYVIVYEYVENSQGDIFATGNQVGIHRSTDGGYTWTAFNDSLENLSAADFICLAVDGFDKLYAGHESGAVYRTLGRTR